MWSRSTPPRPRRRSPRWSPPSGRRRAARPAPEHRSAGLSIGELLKHQPRRRAAEPVYPCADTPQGQVSTVMKTGGPDLFGTGWKRAIFGAFALVVASFSVGTIVSQRLASAIDAAA